MPFEQEIRPGLAYYTLIGMTSEEQSLFSALSNATVKDYRSIVNRYLKSHQMEREMAGERLLSVIDALKPGVFYSGLKSSYPFELSELKSLVRILRKPVKNSDKVTSKNAGYLREYLTNDGRMIESTILSMLTNNDLVWKKTKRGKGYEKYPLMIIALMEARPVLIDKKQFMNPDQSYNISLIHAVIERQFGRVGTRENTSRNIKGIISKTNKHHILSLCEKLEAAYKTTLPPLT